MSPWRWSFGDAGLQRRCQTVGNQTDTCHVAADARVCPPERPIRAPKLVVAEGYIEAFVSGEAHRVARAWHPVEVTDLAPTAPLRRHGLWQRWRSVLIHIKATLAFFVSTSCQGGTPHRNGMLK